MARNKFFLKLDTIPGESEADGHKEEIELDSFSLASSGGPAASGKMDFYCGGLASIATPKLTKAVVLNELIKEATLTLRTWNGKESLDYCKIKFSNCKIMSHSANGTASNAPPASADSPEPKPLAESFYLSFSKIEYEVCQIKDGKLGKKVSWTFDFAAHK